MEINIYCDETCHLENDQRPSMGLGALSCPQAKTHRVHKDLKWLKLKHKLNPNFEIKWTKISPAKIDFYKELIDYFLNNTDLEFRGIIIPDKSLLDHNRFNKGDHDIFYFKMYYQLIRFILNQAHSYNIYLDIKDTRSKLKVKGLCDVLRNSTEDFDKTIVKKVQTIRSHEASALQLCDLILGCICAATRNETTSEAKNEIINHLKNKTGYTLTKTTLISETKLNILLWKSRGILHA